MEHMPDPAAGSWHLDKRVPISLLGALAVQTIFVVSSLTTKSLQIDDHEKRLTRHEDFTRTTDAAINDWARRAGQRQMQLDEQQQRILKLEARDIAFEAAVSSILQQISRIDERTAQLTSTVLEMRSEMRAARQSAAPVRRD